MIKALIRKNDETLLIDIPYQRVSINESLLAVGIQNPYEDICIGNNSSGGFSVTLFSDSNIAFENRLVSLFDDGTSLALANTVCESVLSLNQEQRDEVNYDLANGQYDTARELLRAISDMKNRNLNVNYYCPLEINMPDEEGCEMTECDNRLALQHINDIKALLFNEQNRGDPMIDYFDGDSTLKSKLKSAVWDVEERNGELYGVIRCRFREPLTLGEELEWLNFCSGQCSDGLCEGVEQRPIETDEGEIQVSFWNDSPQWQLMNEQEFENQLLQEQNGGMQL